MNTPKYMIGNTRYTIYPDGRIFDNFPRRNKPNFIAQNTVCGYKTVTIFKDGWKKTMWVHRILAETFLDKPKGSYLVRHLNDKRDDNRLENLKWGTSQENWVDRKRNGKGEGMKGSKNPMNKLNNDDVLDIIILRKFGATLSSLGLAFGVDFRTASKICSGERWNHIKQGI